MSLLTKANVDSKIADHAALTTGIHGVGSLHTAGFHSAGEEVSKVVWRDSVTILSENNVTSYIDFTDLDISSYTSPNAKFAILMLRMDADVIGTGTNSNIMARKNGTTPAYAPELRMGKLDTPNCFYKECLTVGLDENQVLEYKIQPGTGWTIDVRISLLGYIE